MPTNFQIKYSQLMSNINYFVLAFQKYTDTMVRTKFSDCKFMWAVFDHAK